MLVVHLFGGRLDLAPISAFCRRHDLMLVEDSAQAFTGPDSLAATGADVSLISFGMIKTASAVGGALVSVTDAELRSSMSKEQAGWPAQSRAAYAAKLAKAGLLAIFNDPRRFAGLYRLCGRLRIDLDAAISASTRSFATGDALPARIRRRPTPALLALLGRRLGRVDHDRLSGPGRLRRGAEPPTAGGLPAPGERAAPAHALALPGARPGPGRAGRRAAGPRDRRQPGDQQSGRGVLG